MNEKDLKEMMVSEEAEQADVKKEELKAEIVRLLQGLNDVSFGEKVIMEKIRQVLDEHELKYSYDEDEPKHVELGFGMDNKPFKIYIMLQNGKVIFRLCFPFRVQTNAFPLMCMFMAEFNENKAFSLLKLDPDDGELTMEYTYMLEDPAYFNEKYFWICMTSLIYPAQEIYTKAMHLSVGMVSHKDRKLYKKLLEMALETLNGDYDDDDVSYGIELLKSDSLPDLSALLGKNDADEGKEDDFDSDDKDRTSDIMRGSGRKRRVPSFEEFMRMMERAEESGEAETSDPLKKTESALSMFAKREEDRNPQVVGGHEDE